MIVHSDPVTEARWRMTPDPTDVAALAEHLAHQANEHGCPGLVLAGFTLLRGYSGFWAAVAGRLPLRFVKQLFF